MTRPAAAGALVPTPIGLPIVRPIVLPWAVVVSDNQRHGLVGGRVRLTGRYRQRLATASLLVAGSWRGEALRGRAALSVVVHAPDRRRRDLANLLKHLCDALTGAALEDDAQLDDVRVTRGAIDRANPRVELTLTPLDPTPITRATGAQEPTR